MVRQAIMNIENITDIIVLFLGACLVLLFAAVFLIKFIANVYVPFMEERDFIYMEIVRMKAYTGSMSFASYI